MTLEVPRDDEEVYRKAAVLINRKYREYRQVVRKETSAERTWVYVALHVAVELLSDVRDKDLQPVLNKLVQLDSLVAEHLKKQSSEEFPVEQSQNDNPQQ